MNITSFKFPTSNRKKNISILSIALSANGTSSYRDTVSIVSLTCTKWSVNHVCVLTDNVSMIKVSNIPSYVQII
jgi:hypothetical protein